MYQFAFLFAFLLFIGFSFFVYFNYPVSWRKNSMFNLVLLIWHFFGLSAIGVIFTSFRKITHQGLRYEIVRVGTYYYLMILLLTIFFGVRLIISLIYVWVKKKRNEPIPEAGTRLITDKRMHSIVFIAAAYIVCTIGFFNIDILHEKEYDIAIPKQSEPASLTISFLADVHAGSGNWDFTYDDMVSIINRSSPDVVLLGGDIYDETTSDIDVAMFEDALKRIDPPRYGIYYIYGNHDNYTDDWAGKRMEEAGVRVLKDEMVMLGNDIQLIGTMDPKHDHLSVEELFQKTAPDRSKPVIVLTHRPEHFNELDLAGADISLAGHTHGFNFPFALGSPLLEDMYYGEKQYGDMTAITTSGVAAWGWHYKFPAQSEVVTLHLHFTGRN